MKTRDIIIKRLVRREKRWREGRDPMFESSSVADMAFLLLIFFIITGSFVLRQGIFFSLPSRSAGAVTLEQRQIVEVYPRNDGFLYGGKLLDREHFKKVLSDRKREVPDSVLMIYMDPVVRYERLVDTLSVGKEAGVRRVSLKDAQRGG